MKQAFVGCRVLVTREHPGELAELLRERGATVAHVPLIEIAEPLDDGAELQTTLAALGSFDWLIVRSPAGAARVADAAARHPEVRLAAVGATTARVASSDGGRSVELVPDVQLADRLLDELLEANPTPQRMLIVQGDRADRSMTEHLRQHGHDVTEVIGYRTLLRRPDPAELVDADVLLLTSGSAAQAWFDAVGGDTPPLVVAIGPTTARMAEGLGLKISATATDHSLGGLVTELERTLVHAGRVQAMAHAADNGGVQKSTDSKLK